MVFGCTVVIRTRTKGKFGKYKENAQWGFYLGWDPIQWRHIMYGLDTGRLHHGCDFTSYEENFGAIHRFMQCNVHLDDLTSSPPPVHQGENDVSATDGDATVRKDDDDTTPKRLSWMDESIESIKLWQATNFVDPATIDTSLPDGKPSLQATPQLTSDNDQSQNKQQKTDL